VRRTKLLLLFALFALPVLASYLAYYRWQPAGRTNYGELITQVSLKDGRDLSGHVIAAQDFRGRWTLVYLGRGECEANCETLLYYMRQVRTAQGAERDRIGRLWLVTDRTVPSDVLIKQHPGLTVRQTRDAAFLEQFSDGQTGDHIYIVDPLGNLMMRFPPNPDPTRMIKDIKHLLSVSQIG
jgi:SCO1/SenC